MNTLSKQLLTAAVLFSGVLLQGAAEQINAHSLLQACRQAQQRCQADVAGYRLTTEPVAVGHSDDVQVSLEVYRVSGASVITRGEPCQDPRNFCKPTTEILYEDALVRVIKKPGERPGTDILIVSKDHICNMHALGSNNMLPDHIWEISQMLASYLPQGATYTLMTNNGADIQGVQHLHVHFKSNAVLDETALKNAHAAIQAPRTDGLSKPFLFPTRIVLTTVAALGVAAAAAYCVYNWWKTR